MGTSMQTSVLLGIGAWESTGQKNCFYVMTVFFFYQLDAQILYFNTFITFLYMVRALLCSSSGG